jgi:hypothetical protein
VYVLSSTYTALPILRQIWGGLCQIRKKPTLEEIAIEFKYLDSQSLKTAGCDNWALTTILGRRCAEKAESESGASNQTADLFNLIHVFSVVRNLQRPDISFFWGYYILSLSRQKKDMYISYILFLNNEKPDQVAHCSTWVVDFIPDQIKTLQDLSVAQQENGKFCLWNPKKDIG